MHSGRIKSDNQVPAAKYIDPSSALPSAVHKDIHFELAKQFIDQNGDLIRGPVLEIGSGNGKLAVYIARQFNVDVVGLDMSYDSVARAKQEFSANYRVRFFAGDAVRMHYQREITAVKYATVVSFNAMHHIPAHMHYVLYDSIRRMLQPDGRVLFLVPGRCIDLHEVIEEVTKNEKWKVHFHDFDFSRSRTYETPDYYKLHFQRARFYASEEMQEVLDGGVDLDFAGVQRYLRGWLPHLEHLQMIHYGDAGLAGMCNELLDDVATAYFKRMNKDVTQTVHPKITLNKIVAYASELAFFTRLKKTDDKQDVCLPRARL